MRIYVDRRLGDARELIWFSDTLVSVQEYYAQTDDYRPGARLPIDFRRLDESEVGNFTASLDELSIDNELDYVAIFPCDLNSESDLDFTPFLSLSSVVALQASIDHGNRPSITVDPETGLRLGLHLDSWDDLDVASRWKSRNRIVVNRGPGDRYVYVVPVPVEKMAECVASSQHLHPCEIAHTYLRNASGIPCLRMRQSPGVAYVCGTERLVHDACVSVSGAQAVSRHYLGHFVKD